MSKKTIFKLCLYFLGAIFSAMFLVALGIRISTITKHGFSAEQYWPIIIFGSVFSILCAVVSIIKLVILIVRKGKSDEENPVNLIKTAESSKEEGNIVVAEKTSSVEEIETESKENAPAIDNQTLQNKESQAREKKRLSFAERRKKKLLEDPPEKRKPTRGAKAIVVLCIAVLFNAYFTVWAISADGICFHNYSYNRAINTAPDDGEITNYRFYSDYLFRPYFIYKDGEREFKVLLNQRIKGDNYVDYVFQTQEKYAKVLDCALDRHTYLTVNLTARMFEDGHLEISHKVVKERNNKVVFEYDKSGKIYSYKNVIKR